MIAGLGVAALFLVDHATAGQIQQVALEIDVIDAPAPACLPAAAAVVPPAPVAAVGFEQAEHIRQTLTQQRTQRLAFGVAGHDAAAQPLRIVDVAILRCDVEIAHHHQRFTLLLLGLEIAVKALQPLKFVGVFVAAQRRTVRHIEIENAQPLDAGADHPLLLAQPLGDWIVRQQRREAHLHILQREPADDGHAVVGLLTADRHRVAQFLEGLHGEQVIGHLGLLQAEHLGLFPAQPGTHLIQACAHRVDIPGGDPHRCAGSLGRAALLTLSHSIDCRSRH